MNNPWRQGNLLARQPGNSFQTNRLPGNSLWPNHPPRNSTCTNRCLLRTVSPKICHCRLTNQNQRKKTYLNYFYTDLICPSPSVACLTSAWSSMPLSGIHSISNNFLATSHPLWKEVRNKYISEYIILYIVVALMSYIYVYICICIYISPPPFKLGGFQPRLHIRMPWGVLKKHPDAQASAWTD